MKKLIPTLTALVALAIATPALAKSNLPFVGERLFSMGYGQVEHTISIKKDGTTTITAHSQHTGSFVDYQGKYQAYMPYKENGKIAGYYHIKGDEIHLLDKQKKPLIECGNGSRPFECVAPLEKMQ